MKDALALPQRTLGLFSLMCLSLWLCLATVMQAATGDVEPGFHPQLNGSYSFFNVTAMAVQPDGKVIIGGRFQSADGIQYSVLARLNAVGSLDQGFNPIPSPSNSFVQAILVQVDGKIVVAGTFTSMGGVTRNGIARLYADGTLDASFDPNASASGSTAVINSITEQPDGKFIFGGNFASIGGVGRNLIARLNSNGTLDAGFNPALSSGALSTAVYSTALQTDGKIIVGGGFTSVGGVTRTGLARLNADGSLDMGFNPNPGTTIYATAVQSDGKILVAGVLGRGAIPQYNIARLNPDGTLDPSLPGAPTNNLGVANFAKAFCAVVQTDGAILVSGLNNTSWSLSSGIMRMTPTGNWDTNFNPYPVANYPNSPWVYGVMLQGDGRLLIGGDFNGIGGRVLNYLARLDNAAATQKLTMTSSNRVEWLRGGASPEAQWVRFDLSTNNGTSWSMLGNGTRIAGGWELTGLNLPSSGQVRATARIAGGIYCGSGSLAQSIATIGQAKAAQSISFGYLDNGYLGIAPPVLSATASSGLPVTFSSSNPGVATVSGSSLILVGTGTATITANQAGDATYLAAPPASRTLVVNPRPTPPTITVQPTNTTVSGFTLALNATAAGTGPLTYQWRWNGINVPNYGLVVGTTNSGFTNYIFQPHYAGLYDLVVTNVAGQVTSAVATVTYNPAPGTVIAWGDNAYGQSTVPPAAQSGVVAIAAGYIHSVALKADGTVVSWGSNIYKEQSIPAGLGGVVAVSAGYGYTLALKHDGTVAAWGNNTYGQCSVPVGLNSITAISAAYDYAVALKSDGTVVAWGNTNLGQTLLPSTGLTGVVAVAAGSEAHLAITGNGSLIQWGTNTHNQPFGPQTYQIGAKALAGGANAGAFAILDDGSVFSSTTLATPPEPALAISVGSGFAVSLTTNLTVNEWGNNGQSQASVPANLAGVTAISAGDNHVLALIPTPPSVPPSITSQPASLTVAASSNATFTVTATGTAPLSYQWQVAGTNLPGATNATLTLTNVQTNQAGSYAVVISNVAGSVTSTTAMLGVSVPPVITMPPANQTVTVGANVTFNVGVTGTAPLYYQWRLAGTNLPGATNATLTLANVQTNQAGNYAVVVTNTVGSATSSNALLTVNPAPVAPSITTQPANQTVTVGANVTFNVGVTGTAPLYYQWRLTGTNLPGATNATLTLANVQTSQAGNYSVVVTNTAGSATSGNALLTVNPAPVAPGITTQPANQTVTVGANVTFSVGVTGTLPLFYQWRLAGTNLPGATNVTLALANVQTSQAGNYSVVITNIAGSVTSGNALLTVNPATAAPGISSQPASQAVNPGSNVTFTVGVTGTAPFSYQWQLAGTNVPGATNAALILTNVQTNQAGNYSVVITNFAGSVTSSIAVLTVNVPPGITTQPASRAVSIGASVTFTVTATGTAPLSYQWQWNGTNLSGATAASYSLSNVQTNQAGNYWVVITNMAGSVTSSIAVLTVSSAPVAPSIVTQPASQTVLIGSSASFSVGVSGTAPLFYQWRMAGTNLPGATNTTFSLTNVQTNQAGSYSVVITNTAGSATSGNAILTVNPPPVAPSITTQPVDQTAVAGSDAAFTVSATGTAPLFCQWQLAGTNLPGATNFTLSLPNVQTNQAGSYSVAVTNVAGSATSSNAALTVNAPPIITTQPISQGVTAGTGVTFSVGVAGTAPFSYQWLFNGGVLSGRTSASLTLNPVTTNNTGTYQVVITNAAGSVTSSIAALTVHQVVPLLTWNTPSAITYGTALGAGQLNASAGAPGSLIYNPPTGTLLGAGSQMLNALFTPADGSVYATNSAAVTLVVNPAALTATAVSQTRLVGQTNQPLVITYSGFVNGETAANLTTLAMASTTADINSPPGIYPITLSGATAANYSVSHVGGTITVATNLPPSVTFATNAILVLEDCGGQTFSNFATILPGTASNIVSVTVSNDHPALFAVAPALNGLTLTFTPATNANGVATVTIIAQSDGGGVNKATNTFTLTVTPVNDAPGFKLLNTTVLLTWGYNYFAQLGDGTGVDKSSPVPIGNATNWVMITAGDYHTMALRQDGTLWGWGYNFFGELGDGTGASQGTPVQISNETNWQTVVAGNDYTMALKRDGSLWGWGANINYQLGLGYNLFARNPVQVGTATDWKMVAPGETHTLALKRDGTLWAWGDNSHGNLGDGTTTLRPTPVQIGTATDWLVVTAGSGHSVALKRDGTLWAWGYNYFGQLGDGTTADQSSPVQIGTSTNWQVVAAGNYSTLAVKRDGTLWSFDTGGPEQFGTDSDWQTVTAGNSHGLGLKRNGTLWGWGYNNFGQVGDGTTVTRFNPVQVGTATNWLMVAGGGNHTVALALAGGAPPALAVLENSGGFTQENFALNIFAEPAGGSTQGVTFVTTNDSPALFSSQPMLDGSGTLTFTPATNAYGTATVTVIAQDDGGTANGGTNTSAPQTFTITVTAVNQSPRVTFATNNVVVLVKSGAAVFNGFATISTGPANESAQTIQSLTLGNDNNSLFSAPPAIDAGGTLTFTPANNAFGSATVTVVVQDSGGSANGAMDTVTNTFMITVAQRSSSLAWTQPSPVTYGAPLSPTQLNANVTAPGMLTYTPPAGTVLPAGTNRLTVVFAPADPIGYMGATGTVSLVVAPAALTASVASQTRPAGQTNQPLFVNYTGFMNGETVNSLTALASASTVADLNSPPGTYPIMVSGALASNYVITHVGGTITVVSNLPPRVTFVTNNLVVLEDSGTQSVTGFATIVPGPAQHLVSVAVINDTPSLFTVAPALNGGTLTFTPATNANGVANVTVVVQADGGSQDRATNTFTITVTPVNDPPVGPAGTTWTVQPTAGNRNWSSIASSADGTRLAAVAIGDQIYISTDAGVTWTARGGYLDWYSIASSADGMKLAAVANNSYIYTSTDGGTNWWPQLGAPFSQWRAIASSADGAVLAASTHYDQLYVSTDSGATWTASGGFGNYLCLAASADGRKLVAGDYFFGLGSGQIYTSTDSGTTWTARGIFGAWRALASSADGTKLVAGVYGGQLYTSTDSGTNWTARESNRNWISIASSADGARLAALDHGGQIFVSTDSGITWTPRNTNRDWVGIASSASGTMLATAEAGANGAFYTSTTGPIGFNSVTVLENSGAYPMNNFAGGIIPGPPDESAQIVSFLVTNDNNALFSLQPTIAIGGRLSFTPATNAYGSATVTVIAQDNGGTANGGTDSSAPQTFTITVTAVNQAPSVTFATNTVAVFANSGPALGNGFATLSTGPANESAQAIQSVTVVNDNNALFSVQPAINAGGTLTFTPANNTAGSATVTVVVQDNGGTANGGVDSATNRFTIRVNQLVPSLTWNAPQAVTYGTPLGAAQLNATPSVPGLLTYVPPAGTVLPVGTNVLSVTLAPTDATTYVGATATVNWVVNRAALTATAASQTRAYGTPNTPTTVNYSGFVNGETVANLTSPAVANTTADINSLPGTYPIVASGATAANYAITHVAGLLTVTAIPPVLVTGPTNQTVLAGADVTFVTTAVGAPAPLYQWYFNATNALPGATNATLVVTNAQPVDQGSYTIVAANAGGSVTSAVATLTVYVLPAITTQPASQSVVQGGTVTFRVAATGTSPLSYQWQSNGVDIAGATSTSLTLLNAQPGQAGIYSVVVTNVAGRTTSSNAVLTVIVPPTVLMSPQDVTVPVGTNVTFGVTVSGTPPFTFQWLKNGTNLPAATNATLTLLNVQSADQGSYKVTVGNPAGFDTSSAATLTVLDPPLIFAQPQSTNAVLGSNVTLTVGVTGSVPLYYQWFKGAVAMPGETNQALTFTNLSVTNTGTYSVLVTNAVGSVLSDPALLNVHVPPFISVQPQGNTLAVGSGLNLRVTAGGDGPLAYQWRKNGTNLPGATANPFTVNSLTTNDAGSYAVVVTNAYGAVTSAPALITVGVPMAPVILTNLHNQTVLAGTNVTLEVVATGWPALSYQWISNGVAVPGNDQPTLTLTNVSLTDAGNYYVQIFNATGFTNSATATLTVQTSPAFTVQPQPVAVANGGVGVFTVAATGMPAPGLNWFKDGVRLTNSSSFSGAATTTLLVFVSGTNAMGNYWAVATNATGSATSSVVALTVLLAPTITSQPTNVVLFRTNPGSIQPASFSVAANGTPPLLFQWRRNGTDLAGATNQTLLFPNVTRADNDLYSVVVSNAVGMTASSNVWLRVRVAQRLAGPQRLPDGRMRLAFTDELGGMPGTNDLAYVEVQYATNLLATNVVWTKLNNVVTATNGMLLLDEPPGLTGQRRFYRVIER